MSDVAKPVEETQVAAPATTEPTTAAPVTESAADTTATEPKTTGTEAESAPAAATTETPATTTGDAAAVAPNEETVAKNDATPATEGVLGYKAPGLVKSLRFKKTFFWFSDEALKPEHLAGYLRTEKPEVAHPNAAWSTQTGKGLLYFAKRAEDKSSPLGIINLAEISEVTQDPGPHEFFFKLHGHKHTFQTDSHKERASWIVAIEANASEATGMKDEIVGSEGYKSHVDKFAKPFALVAPHAAATPKPESATPNKSLESKPKDEVKKEPAASTNSSEDEKKKSRSQSRKRGSILGTLLGKKEEHDDKKEIKKEEKAEEKAEKKAEKEEKQEEKKIEKEEKKEEKKEAKTGEPTTHDAEAAGAVGAAAVAAPVVAAEENKTDNHEPTTSAEATPTSNKAKRGSVFGNFFKQKGVSSPTTEKTEKDVGPAVPAKDKEVPPVTKEAPQLGDPVDASTSKPINTAAVTAPVDAELAKNTTAKDTTGKDTTNQPAETGSSPSKGGFLDFIKKQEARFGDKKENKKEEKAEKKEEKADKKADVPAAATTSTPAQTTTADPTTSTSAPVREKRRTSLFGSLGTKKEKKGDSSDNEVTDGETKQKSTPTSPLPKLANLFRNPSKGGKKETAGTTDAPPVPESGDKPAPISKDEPTTANEPMTNGTTATEGPKKSIGDVVPDAVTVGQSSSPPVHAAA